ncbi:MAG: hypothetical protein ABSD97_07305 [Acidimicrobiales bacterium]|jgi:hypothetical protein
MNGYVEAGYVVVLGTLGSYGGALLLRERAARRRAGGNGTGERAGNGPGVATQVHRSGPADEGLQLRHRSFEETGTGTEP